MVLASSSTNAREDIDLNGQWAFALDPQDEGISAAGRMRDARCCDPCPRLVGRTGLWRSANEPSIGSAGASSTIMKAWLGTVASSTFPRRGATSRFGLVLKGVRWRSEVWMDGAPVGMQESLSTPHVYDLTALATPGSSYRLTIRIDNRMIYPLQRKPHQLRYIRRRVGAASPAALCWKRCLIRALSRSPAVRTWISGASTSIFR